MTSKLHAELWQQAVTAAVDWLTRGSALTPQQRSNFYALIEQIAEYEREQPSSVKRLILMDAVEIVAKEQHND